MFGVLTREYCEIVPKLQYVSGKDYLINQKVQSSTHIIIIIQLHHICYVMSMCGTNVTNTKKLANRLHPFNSNLLGRYHKFTRMRQTPTKGKTVRMSIQ